MIGNPEGSTPLSGAQFMSMCMLKLAFYDLLKSEIEKCIKSDNGDTLPAQFSKVMGHSSGVMSAAGRYEDIWRNLKSLGVGVHCLKGLDVSEYKTDKYGSCVDIDHVVDTVIGRVSRDWKAKDTYVFNQMNPSLDDLKLRSTDMLVPIFALEN